MEFYYISVLFLLLFSIFVPYNIKYNNDLKNKIKENEEINNKLTNQIKEKDEINIRLKNEIKDKDEINIKLTNQIKKNEEINNKLTNQIKEKDDIIDDNNKNNTKLTNRIKELEDILNTLKEKDKLFEKYIKIKNENNKLFEYNSNLEKIIGSTNSKNINYEINKDLRDVREENSELKKKIEILENSPNKDFENYKKIDYNPEYVGKQLEFFYDLIINIKSIRELSEKDKGWEIKWNKNRDSIIDFIKNNKKLLNVGILGNGNIGKSFLLSRIFKENIPSGYSVITEGLSIKINKEKFYALLDSAGLQTPLLKFKGLKNDENEYELLYKDKTQTENFIQNLILHFSDMLLIVVGKITFNEQRLINKIKNELENQNSRKPIFIIHNLMNFHKIEQVEEHINNTLLNSASFKLEKVRDIKRSKKNEIRYYYIENDKKEKDFYIYHLIMAREMTEAGDYYNSYLYEFLEERFNEFPDRNSFYILDEIKNKFAEWSSDILEDPINIKNLIIESEDNVEKRIVYETINDEQDIPKIVPKACLSNEIGTSFYRSSGYEPPYYYFVEGNKYLVIVMELPGVIEIEDVYADINQNKIFIKGEKSKFNNEIIIENDLEMKFNETKIKKNTCKFGKFNLIIPYENEIKLSDEIPLDEKYNGIPEGIKIFKFPLAKRRENKKKMKNDI